MEQLHHLWHIVYQLPWSTIGTYVLTSGVVSAVFQLVKKHVTIKDKLIAERTKALIVPLAGVFSAIPTAIYYLSSQQGEAWRSAMPKEFTFIFTGAVALHAFLISPGYNKLAASLTPYWRAVEQLKAETAAIAQANQPSVQVAPAPDPVATPVTDVSDFKL